VLRNVAEVEILVDQHDGSSRSRLRPDFTAVSGNMLLMKGEAKAIYHDMVN
jgi:hypothetical protein